jgi:receptor protein-tyrosine kinase
LRAQGYLVPGEPAAIVEEIRLIKRPILRQARSETGPTADRARLVMVTSALPQEGKTFLALNLALSMALEHDTTVLLVDTDIWKRSVQRVLGFEAERGLFDLVADEALDMSEVLVRTNLDNLTILPAGRDHPGANELLASARMARLMEEISRRYSDRIVLFDTPPALVRTETGVLATHVGQVILVVGAGETSDAAMREALELFKDGPRVGLVMNKLRAVYRTERFGHLYSAYFRPGASHGTSGT